MIDTRRLFFCDFNVI